MPEDTPLSGFTARFDPTMTNAELKEQGSAWQKLEDAGFTSLASKRALLTGDFAKWGGIDGFLAKEGKRDKLQGLGAKFFNKLGFDPMMTEQIMGRPSATQAKFAGQDMSLEELQKTGAWSKLTDAGFTGDEAKQALLTGDYSSFGSMENFLANENKRGRLQKMPASFFEKLGLDKEGAFAKILRAPTPGAPGAPGPGGGYPPPTGGDLPPTGPLDPLPTAPPPGPGEPGYPIEPGQYPGGYNTAGAVPVQQPGPQPGPDFQKRYTPNYLPQPEWAKQTAQGAALRLPPDPTLPPPVYGQNTPGTPYQPAQAPTGTPVAGRTGGATANAQPTITQAQQDAAIQAAILAATQNQPIPGK